MNKQIKEITLAAMVLSLTCVLTLIQIPFIPSMGLSLDFSYVTLIIGRRYIGITKTLILCFIFPWFTLLSTGTGSWPGAVFLLFQSIFVVILDYVLFKEETTVAKIMWAVLFITIYSMFLNALVVAPMWMTTWDGTWAEYYNNFFALDNAPLWMVISIIFNPVKFMIVYIAIYLLLPNLKKEI